jgi:hypothetical protein
MANRPIRTPANGTSASRMRPSESRAASVEPMATPTVNSTRNRVTTLSAPPISSFTRVGSSESTTAPTSQNQLTTSEPTQVGRLALSSLSSAVVPRTMLKSIFSSGARSPVRGICRAAIQLMMPNTKVRPATAQLLHSAMATPPPTVPARMARKVAVSTSALPATSSFFAR